MNNISSGLSSNSKASASELLENTEEMFPWYYMVSDVINIFKSSTTPWCVTRRERVNSSPQVQKNVSVQKYNVSQ